MEQAKRLLTWVAESRAAAAVLILGCIAERVAWTLAGHVASLDTELRNVAVHWAATGAIADAFRPGSGPTAHVGALPVLLPGLVFRAFGADSVAASVVLTALSALSVALTALVLNRLFARLGTSAVARGVALLTVCLIPLHLELESRSLRIYENGWAALLVATALLTVVRLDQRGNVATRDIIGLSALAALSFALSPITGAVVVAILALLAFRRPDWMGRFQALAILVIAMTATTLPWALRNRAELGAPVPTRSNFGLEFAIGTHAGAVAPADPAASYLARLDEIHPHGSARGWAAMQAAGGEVAYSRQLSTQTWGWAAANPAATARIWGRHIIQFYFPPAWLWHHTALPDATMPVRIVIVQLIAVLALFGLALALARRTAGYVYLLPPVVLLPLLYMMAQPLVRYRYVIASLLIYLAADCVARLRRPA